MARITTPLTDTEIKKAKAQDKDYKLRDGQGLYILIKKNAKKFWRFDYKFNDKRNTISFGEYPNVTLKEARDKREQARENIQNGISPKISTTTELNNTFKTISDRWFEIKKAEIQESTYKRNYAVIKNNCEDIMYKNMKDIKRKDILALIDKMNSRGIYESIKRMMGQLYNIWKYAVTYEIVEHNIIADIDAKTIVKKKEVEHFAAITKPDELKQLLKDIKEYRNNYKSDISTVIALEIAPFVALRPNNIQALEWSEVNFDKKIIEISGNKMKNGKDYIVPLVDTVIEKLREIEQYSRNISKYVFVSSTHTDRHISENTLNNALKRMGYKGVHTMHGFRSTFSTILHENITKHGKHSDIIETCLSHATGGTVKQSYDRYDKMKYYDERVELYKWWEKYINEMIDKK